MANTLLSVEPSLESFLAPLKIPSDKLLLLAEAFTENFTELARNSPEQFLPMPVTTLPRGSEQGGLVAVDIGGSRMRIAFVELNGSIQNKDSSVNILNKHSWDIGSLFKTGKVEELFDWIGQCLCEVLDERAIEGRPWEQTLRAGVTFSFPMQQETLSTARLMPQGKGFTMSPDLDMATLLRNGYANATSKSSVHYPQIEFCSIANDTVSTLAAASYIVGPQQDVAVAVVLGTGTNAASLLPAEIFGQQKIEKLTNAPFYVANTEWGIRGTGRPLDALKLKTTWDLILDSNHDNPGFMPFEQMTSGRYLGEITRIVLRDYLDRFPEMSKDVFSSPYSLTTEMVSSLLSSPESNAALKLEEEAKHAYAIRLIGGMVAERSAALLAAACVGLLRCCKLSSSAKSDGVVIGTVGTTITKFPLLTQQFEDKINFVLRSTNKPEDSSIIQLRPIKDGGIIGAAVLACTNSLTSV